MKRRNFLQAASAAMAAGAAGAAEKKAKGKAAENIKKIPPERRDNKPKLAPRFGDGRDWFFQKRFGMFVHWGIYAIPAWHEQHQWRFRVPRAEYEKLARQWNPVNFNPDAWLDLMREAGMKYICFRVGRQAGGYPRVPRHTLHSGLPIFDPFGVIG